MMPVLTDDMRLLRKERLFRAMPSCSIGTT